MHLTLNLGLLNHINLIWNHYEGFVPQDNSYKIWRQTPGIGWEMIDVVPSNLNSYTDQSPPDEDLWYFVEAVHPTGGCTPLKASTLNSSRSNRKTKLKSGLNQAPVGLSLDISTISEDLPAGSLVGRFTTSDSDEGDTHSYSLIAGFGGDNNNSFTINGDSLLSGEIFDYETKNTYGIRVSTTDGGELSFEKSFVILITDEVEVGISQVSGQELMIYPNPFNESATIRFSNPSGNSYKMVLTDLTGKIYRIVDNITTAEYLLEKDDLRAGLYFIEMRGPKTYRGKILIE
jgi:hypothetical protein